MEPLPQILPLPPADTGAAVEPAAPAPVPPPAAGPAPVPAPAPPIEAGPAPMPAPVPPLGAGPAPAPAEAAPPQAPTLARALRRWTGILSAYFTAQTLTQLAGLAAGILLVRFMPVQQFALYTLATSVVSFFGFASDLGSTSSLFYFYQRTARTGEDFQPYLAAVLSLRRVAFLLGAAGVLVAFPRAAAGKGFGLGDVAAVTAALLLCVWFQIASSVRILAARLVGHYGRAYRAEVAGGGVRLAVALLMVGASLLRAWLGMLGSALAAAATAMLAGSPATAPRPAAPAADPAAAADAAPGGAHSLGPYRRQILRYLVPSLPGALYFSIQGPLVVWLAATFGGARNIAEVGALGRLGLIVGMFSGLTGVVLLPRLARIVDERLYLRRFLQYGGLLLALALGMLAVAVLFPGALLLILGKHYSGLHRELLLVIAGAGLTLLGGYVVSVNLGRSWNRWETLAVLLYIAAQAGFVAVLPLGTTAGVLQFNLLSAAAGLALQLAITAVGFWRPRWVQWMP
jgi:O-antigen/teichoic acid export membrane protein